MGIGPLVAALVLAGNGPAQTSRGTVSGTVTDPSGAVVAGAGVVLTQSETRVRRSTTTNEAGIYRFDAVDLGLYELKVTQTGFNAFLATRLGVEANRTTTIDLRLEVGGVDQQVTVSAESSEALVKDGPLRGGNFLPREVSELPLVGLNPLSLARTLPGVIQTSGSFAWRNSWEQYNFSVNGQRHRSNNFLLDGTDNNDFGFTGPAQPFSIADAVEEVSGQTANYGVEFGRTGGGVFNVVTKAGTNNVHGTLLWRYQSQRFNSVSNFDKLNGIPQSVFSRNVFGFTLGGPVRKNKTFLFGGFQQDNHHSTQNFPLVVPTQEAVARLRSLFPSNPRLDLYLNLLGDLRGTAAPIPIVLGLDPISGADRGSVQFATAPLALPATNDGPQWLIRLDHHRSDAHRFSLRFVYDSRVDTPSSVSFPGFLDDQAAQNQNVLFADTYTFSASFTNEFRFSYGRLRADEPSRPSPQAVPLSRTLPSFTIRDVSAPSLVDPQYRYANNLLFQETQTKLTGRHTFRYGVEFLGQVATQQARFVSRGAYQYSNASSYSAFANFLDDFSGPGPNGNVQRQFGDPLFHPSTFRQSYFFQDTWKATPALTLTLGLRYENFGQPLNVLPYPGFPGFEPERFLERTEVRPDNNNFGPSFGLAWSPSFQSGWLARLFGDRQTVWRGGYQISYDAWFTQMVSLQVGSAPNSRVTNDFAPPTGRGYDNFLARLPATAGPADPLEPQTFSNERDLRNPYTERWSFGFQRQMPGNTVLDTSYVGSVSHKLLTRADFNPQQLNGRRLYPDLGQRLVRTSEGNSAYHSLQARVDRRFSGGFQLTASYTWSRFLDSTSEGGASATTQTFTNQLTSMPVAQGGMRIDRGLSDFHRGQRLTLAYIWVVPGPTKGWQSYALGGWSIAGITTFQSGTPFTVQNRVDRNNDASPVDRPDIGNAAASVYSRAVLAPACGSGYRNRDTNACVAPSDVHWVQAPVGLLPNASTVGRNTLLTGGTNNFDLTLFKSFPMGEGKRLELRWEALNALNHPQFVEVPGRDVMNTPGPEGGLPSRFLNRDFTDSGIRSMWVQVKVIF
jgi:outer membrane receptor protein involved in Fe transport